MADIDALLRQLDDDPDTSDVDAMLKALDDARNPSGWTPWGSAGAGAAQGGTLNWADEILSQGPTAMIAGAAESMRTGEPVRDVTNRNTQMVGDTFAAAQEANPGAYQAGNIGGAVGVGLMSAPIAGGSNLGWTMARGAGIGATEGAVAGAGAGEGGRDRFAKGLGYGLVGAGLGGAAPAAIAGLSAGLRAGSDALAGVPNAITGRASNSRARKVIADLLQQSGQSGDDVTRSVGRAAAEGQPEFRVMDALGRPGQRKASGVVRSGGPGAEEIAQYLSNRQADATGRMVGFTDEAFELGGNTAEDIKGALRTARGDAASAAYEEAVQGAGPVNLNAAIGVIDDSLNANPILGDSALTNTEIGRRIARLRGQMQAGGEQLIDFRQVLQVKKNLGREIRKIKVRGDDVPPELGKIYRELDSALEASSGKYRAANDAYREASEAIDGLKTGARSAGGQRRMENELAEFANAPPAVQSTTRQGFGDSIIKPMQNKRADGPDVSKNFAGLRRKAEIDAMAVNPDVFQRQVGREGTMFQTYNRALQGSRTADNIEDITRNAEMGPWVRAGQKALNLNLGDAAAEVGTAIAPYLRNENEATRALIAKALLSKDPEKVLMPAIKAGQASEARKRIAEALVRAGLREPAYGAIAP